jgi:hypothetical protein
MHRCMNIREPQNSCSIIQLSHVLLWAPVCRRTENSLHKNSGVPRTPYNVRGQVPLSLFMLYSINNHDSVLATVRVIVLARILMMVTTCF